ncbi:MAG: A/G-specific adenine glycosylase [Bacteroidetes bacterium]|nr:A/G-specific adenine glycosylase [Bacteroidota bacterium]
MNRFFTRALLKWNESENNREIPWKGEKNPYLIWLSEIILQQTRTEQGMPYFLAFKKRYPTVHQLAAAPEDEVMRMWQGLGYYSRARNLHATAKLISKELDGKFPDTFEKLKKLKGVGDYTAAAIASFAFDEPKAVVDGNVIRVLSRFSGISTPFDTANGKKEFAAHAQALIDKNNPGAYNQAIMDFGATICVPQNPGCNSCPLNKKCFAATHQLVKELPYREKKTGIKERYFNYVCVWHQNALFIQKRTENNLWKNMYQPILLESNMALAKVSIRKKIGELLPPAAYVVKDISEELTQLLSHRKIRFRFIDISIKNRNALQGLEGAFVPIKKLHQYAFPRTVHLYLKQKGLL